MSIPWNIHLLHTGFLRPLIYMSATHLCSLWANSLFSSKKKKEKKGGGLKMLRSYILPHPSLALSPGSPRLPFPVQLNTEPRIGWSRCLGRADIFETLTPRCARKSFNRGLCVFLLHCWKQNKFHSTSLQLLLPLVQQHFMEIHSILAATQCCHLIHPSIFLTRVIPKWCCWGLLGLRRGYMLARMPIYYSCHFKF